MGDEQQRVLVGRDAQEGDARGVGRPGGVAVLVGGGVEVSDRAGGNGIDSDEAVIVAIADERQARAVG
jgi:hypothetical protein